MTEPRPDDICECGHEAKMHIKGGDCAAYHGRTPDGEVVVCRGFRPAKLQKGAAKS